MFIELKELFSVFKLSRYTTVSTIFFIHCSLTCIVLLGLSMLTTAVENYGIRIKCIPSIEFSTIESAEEKFRQEYQVKNKDFFTTFCWMNSTYSANKTNYVNRFHKDIHKYPYYKWVSVALFVHALLFYAPKIIWNSLERGLMKHLVTEVKTNTDFKDRSPDDKSKIIQTLKSNLKENKNYAIHYWVCEGLCLVNVIVQLIFIDRFFNGEFLRYGWNVLTNWFHWESRKINEHIFPHITKCTFFMEGSNRTYEFICILPVNVLNKKTYLFLWLWLIILLGLFSALIVYRAVMIIFPSVRLHIFRIRNKLDSSTDVIFISSKLDIRDWWIVYMLCDNLDHYTCCGVVKEWVKTMRSKGINIATGAHDGLNDPETSC